MAETQIAESDDEIASCFPLLVELRPQLQCETFVDRVRRQGRDAGYRLMYVADGGEVRAVAGFRVSECLAWGRFLYVDDLITLSRYRGRGYGGLLIDRLMAYARAHACDELHLDSGIQRHDAHRFYVRKGFEKNSYHFARRLQREASG